jgi:hypothetical protein
VVREDVFAVTYELFLKGEAEPTFLGQRLIEKALWEGFGPIDRGQIL